jgi:hypothetical protein
MEDWEIHWKDYYKILQIDSIAEQEVVKGAYDRLAKKYHPDVNKDPRASERMKEINCAYEVLGNPENRSRYDSVWRQKQGKGVYEAKASVPPRPGVSGVARTRAARQPPSKSRVSKTQWKYAYGLILYPVVFALICSIPCMILGCTIGIFVNQRSSQGLNIGAYVGVVVGFLVGIISAVGKMKKGKVIDQK